MNRLARSAAPVVCVGILVSCLLVVSGAGATTVPVTTVRITAVDVPGTGQLSSVSCSSAAFCMAIGGGYESTVLVPIINGVAQTPEAVPAAVQDLWSISCPEAEFCDAVGDAYESHVEPGWPLVQVGAVVVVKRGQIAGWVPIAGPNGLPGDPDGVSLYGIGCYQQNCVASGWDQYAGAFVVPLYGPDNGNEELVLGGPGDLLSGVTCRSDTSCLVTGNDQSKPGGLLVPVSDGTPDSPHGGKGIGYLSIASCYGQNPCVAVGNNDKGTEGVVAAVNKRSLGSGQLVKGTQSLSGVSCAGTVYCAAVGTNPSGRVGVVVPIKYQIPQTVLRVAGAASLGSVSCPAVDFCVAVGSGAGGGVMAVFAMPQ
ncbi:MAG: hypothetical protein WAM97_15665 [Acidimicrobiales bacterium]